MKFLFEVSVLRFVICFWIFGELLAAFGLIYCCFLRLLDLNYSAWYLFQLVLSNLGMKLLGSGLVLPGALAKEAELL